MADDRVGECDKGDAVELASTPSADGEMIEGGEDCVGVLVFIGGAEEDVIGYDIEGAVFRGKSTCAEALPISQYSGVEGTAEHNAEQPVRS